MQVKTTNPTATQGPSGGTGPSGGPPAAGLALVQKSLAKTTAAKASDSTPPLKLPKLTRKNHPNQSGGRPTNAVHPKGHPVIPAQDGNLLDTALMPHLANLGKLSVLPNAAFHTGLMEAHGQGVEPGRSAASILSAALRGE